MKQRTYTQIGRLFSIFLLLSISSSSFALDRITIGGITYSILLDHTLRVEGVQEAGEREIVIPDTVEYDGEKFPVRLISFNSIRSKNLERLVIPKTVTEIFRFGNHDYRNPIASCPSLQIIEVDEDNEWLSATDGVLFNKEKTELYAVPEGKKGTYRIPGTVKEIYAEAFRFCHGLKEIDIPESVITIYDGAFMYCDGLRSIVIPSCSTLADGVFIGTNLDSVVFPEGMDKIGYEWFSYSSMTRFIIPDGVKDIGYRAFSDCESLESITIPNSVTSIGSLAFSRCKSLKHIVIPSSVTSIGEWAFSHCGIENLEIEKGIKVIGSAWFKGCDQMTSLVIPEGVTHLGSTSFEDCGNLRSVEFPSTLEEITKYAFRRCISLKEVHLPKFLKTLDKAAFDGCPLERVFIERLNIEVYKDFFDALDKSVVLYVHQRVLNKAKELYSGTVLSIEDYETGISHVPAAGSNNEERLYDLQGRRLKAAPQRGMYIRNGRKYVVK